ncbi:MAG TPA: chaperone modulator CbpM [Flavobacterium sp.]|jgi:hypothetical protein
MPEELISITEFCNYYSIKPTFVDMLEDSGIIQLRSHGIQKYIHEEQLNELERYRMLHFELHINLEGIDAIRHLLQRQSELLSEIERLRSTLRLYE